MMSDTDTNLNLAKLPEDQQATIRWLTDRLANDPEPEPPQRLPDFDNTYHSAHSALCILSLFEHKGMEHHEANLINDVIPHLDWMKYEWEVMVRRSQETRLELEKLKAEANQ